MSITITNEHVGGFLIIEGILSLVCSRNKQFIPQAARLVRVGIGAYIYERINFQETVF